MSRYEGFTNWATWNVAMNMNNVYGAYKKMREHRPYTAFKAERIVRSTWPKGTPEMTGDRYTFPAYVGENEVNWQEIADDFNAD